jgi:hypothetical protein
MIILPIPFSTGICPLWFSKTDVHHFRNRKLGARRKHQGLSYELGFSKRPAPGENRSAFVSG